MKQNKNGRCFLFRFFSKQTMKHGDLLNDLPNPCNCETSLFSRTTHFTSKLISFSNFFLQRLLLRNPSCATVAHFAAEFFRLLLFFFLRLPSQTGSPRFADSKLEPARALDPRRWPKGSKLWEREWRHVGLPLLRATFTWKRLKNRNKTRTIYTSCSRLR